MEGYIDPDPTDHARPVAFAASARSTSAPAAHFLFLRLGPFISADQSGRPALWFSAVSRQNLDRRFCLHDVSGAVPHDQQPNERTAKTVRKNGCAPRVVHR